MCVWLFKGNDSLTLENWNFRKCKDCFGTRQEFEREQMSGATVGLVCASTCVAVALLLPCSG